MATLAQIRARVTRNLIDTPTAIQTGVDGFINDAQKTAMRKRNFAVMQTVQNVTTVGLTRNLSAGVPANWKEPWNVPYRVTYLGAVRSLAYAPSRIDALTRWGAGDIGGGAGAAHGGPVAVLAGAPDDMGAQSWEVYPLPDAGSDYTDGAYRISIPYWRYLPPLAGDGDQNWLTNNIDDWLERAATAYGFFVNEDEARGQKWTMLADMKWNEAVVADKNAVLAHLTHWSASPDARAPHLYR